MRESSVRRRPVACWRLTPIGGSSANLDFIEEPDAAAAAYAQEFRDRITSRALTTALAVGSIGGVLIIAGARFVTVRGSPVRRRLLAAGMALGAIALSASSAVALFQRWECNGKGKPGYGFAGDPELSFSSPQTRELALQVRPFIEKNTTRIEERARDYRSAAEASFAAQLESSGEDLRPRAGEIVVSAEADPQGAFVGVRVRGALMAMLLEHLGGDAPAVRTISGDITSNGTVAEDDFVAAEVAPVEACPQWRCRVTTTPRSPSPRCVTTGWWSPTSAPRRSPACWCQVRTTWSTRRSSVSSSGTTPG